MFEPLITTISQCFGLVCDLRGAYAKVEWEPINEYFKPDKVKIEDFTPSEQQRVQVGANIMMHEYWSDTPSNHCHCWELHVIATATEESIEKANKWVREHNDRFL